MKKNQDFFFESLMVNPVLREGRRWRQSNNGYIISVSSRLFSQTGCLRDVSGDRDVQYSGRYIVVIMAVRWVAAAARQLLLVTKLPNVRMGPMDNHNGTRAHSYNILICSYCDLPSGRESRLILRMANEFKYPTCHIHIIVPSAVRLRSHHWRKLQRCNIG